MKRREIEKELIKEISTSVPDVLDNILIACQEDKEVENIMEKSNMQEKSKLSFFPKLVGVLATAMLCLIGIFGVNQYNENYKIDSIVEFDVNPSVELRVNKNEKIIAAIPLNADGEKILGDMELKNTNIDVATNAIIGSILKNGYISNDANSILVSVQNDDKEKGSRLQEKISKDIEEIFKENSINGAILAQTYDNNEAIKKQAQENNLSEGKSILVNKILSSDIKDINGEQLTFGQLSKMSINELNVLLDSKQTKLDNVSTQGEASKSSYIGEDKAKSIACSDAKIEIKDITNERINLDYDDGVLVYEVDIYVGRTKYEYEVNAKTGVIIDKEIDYYDDDFESGRQFIQNTSKVNQTAPNEAVTANNAEVIGADRAKLIAFSDAGILSINATKARIELERDDGKLVYELEFKVERKEYEYKIDAYTGKILERDIGYDDD